MRAYSCCLAVVTGLLAFGGAASSYAQYEGRTLGGRLEKMERDLQLLQRQVARGEAPAGSDAVADPSISPAQFEVRINQLEEEIRKLNGKIEETGFRSRQLSERLDKIQSDNDFRFSQIEKQLSTAPHPDEAAPEKNSGADDKNTPADKADKKAKKSDTAQDHAEQVSSEADADAAPQEPAKTKKDKTEEPVAGAASAFDNPKDHYNHAFRLLRQSKHAEAGKEFSSFIAQYPKDPLAGNAYYWLGETYYVQRDFVKAADSFRQGFEAVPKGPKAADNLLKLSMSLSALKQNDKACVVLQQVLKKFGTSANIKQKAEQEIQRIDCK